MSTTLPPALSELGLSAALEDFTAALGSARVLTGEADLKLYRDPSSMRARRSTRPPPC
jgi:hypothetical protein